MDTNPTQLTGLTGFVCALLACGAAARRGAVGLRPIWWVLAAVHTLMMLDIAFDVRHIVHHVASDWAREYGQYGERRGPQGFLLLVVVALAIVAVAAAVIRRRHWPASLRLAAAGTIGCAALIAAEAVSLHALDRLFYLHLGPVLLIGWLWAAGAAVTTVGAVIALRFGSIIEER